MLLNLIKHQQPDIDKIYLYGKDPLESKYQLLINRIEKLVIENLKKTKSIHWSFIDYEIDSVYETLKDKEKESGDIIWWYDSRYRIW